MTTADGIKIRVESDDGVHPDKLYAEVAIAEIFASTTAATITMASTAAAKDLGNTAANGVDLANSFTAKGVTVSLTAGTFTVDKTGTYRLYFSGRVTGEEDEDVTLAWHNNGSALGAPARLVIEYDATTGVSELTQPVSHECKVDLDKSDVIKLTVLGSDNEVISFQDFVFGLELVSSETFEND